MYYNMSATMGTSLSGAVTSSQNLLSQVDILKESTLPMHNLAGLYASVTTLGASRGALVSAQGTLNAITNQVCTMCMKYAKNNVCVV